MQQVQSRLSIVSKVLNSKPLNSFEFRSGGSSFSRPGLQIVEEDQTSSAGELEFLINASKLYSRLCPSLSSRLICKVANLTSEIDQTKSYREFFSGNVCPKCFSVYLMGANCRLDVRPLKGAARKRLRDKLLKQSKVASSQFANYSFKHVSITCSFCGFASKKLYWEKKARGASKPARPGDAHGSRGRTEDILDYSNYIVGVPNAGVQARSRESDPKKESPRDRRKAGVKRGSRFFSGAFRAGCAPREETPNSEAVPKDDDGKSEPGGRSSQGKSFYDILSMLG